MVNIRSWFCKHDDQILDIVYAPPTHPMMRPDVAVSLPLSVERLIHGTTTFLFRCTECKRTETVVCLGKPITAAERNEYAEA